VGRAKATALKISGNGVSLLRMVVMQGNRSHVEEGDYDDDMSKHNEECTKAKQGTDTIFLGFQPGIDISLVIIQQQELPTFKQATRHVDASRNTHEQVSWR